MKNLFKNKKYYVLLVALLFLLLPQIASASNSVGTITITLGRVDLLKPGTERAVAVFAGHRLEMGDVVRTKSESKAELALNDGSIIRLAQKTRFEITEFVIEGGERNKSSFRLLRGKIRAIVSDKASLKGNPGSFEVNTPTAIAGVRGTDFYIYYIGSSGILVTEGTVAVFSPPSGKFVSVTAGQATNVGHGMPPEPPRRASQAEIHRHDHDTDPGFEESFNNSGVSLISELVGELAPFERHLYVFELLAQNDPEPPPSDPPPSDPPPSDPPPSEPPPSDPPPSEPPPTEPPFPPPPPPPDTEEPPPPWTPEGPPGDPSPGGPPLPPPAPGPPPPPPPDTGMPFPPTPPPPDNGQPPPPPWTPEGPPGDPSPPPQEPPAPPVPAPGNSGLPFPPPTNAPVNSPNTPPPWQADGPPGNPNPGRPN